MTSKILKCIKSFSVEKYDEDGFRIDGEYQEVEQDSEWFVGTSTIISGEIHLDSANDNSYLWIEIPNKLLDEYFISLNMKQKP